MCPLDKEIEGSFSQGANKLAWSPPCHLRETLQEIPEMEAENPRAWLCNSLHLQDSSFLALYGLLVCVHS